VLLSSAAAKGQDFSFVVLPDTQRYAETNSPIFSAQTQWVASERATRSIVFAPHLGDCVQNGDTNLTEWQTVDAAMSLIENPATTGLVDGVPYGIAVGNRDQSPAADPGPGTTIRYNQFFGQARFLGRGYYGGHYGADNDNHYTLFEASGMDFIAIFVEYDTTPDPAVLAWADVLLTTHASRRAIVVSHYVLNTGNPGTFSAQGHALYDALKHHPNLFLILGGHEPGEGVRTDVFQGNTVHTVLADYQGRPNGGDGWLRVMEFSPANDEIRVKTYSPWLDQWETDADSDFTLPYDMDVACTTDGECDDGRACTADSCTGNVCVNSSTCAAGTLCADPAGICEAPPPFTAYNDFAWAPGQLETNITKFTSSFGGSGLPSSGALIDYETGATTHATLSVVGGTFDGSAHAAMGEPAAGGTDGYSRFNGRVDPTGVISYQDSPAGNLSVQLSGLLPGATYEISYLSHRDRYGWNRAQSATLAGASAFTNESSNALDDFGNPLFSGPSDTSVRLPSDNDSGWIAEFTGVKAGSDGLLSLEIDFNGSDPGSAYRGKYASALRVRYLSVCAVDADCDDGNACTDDSCVAGTCSYGDNLDPCDDGNACTTIDVCDSGICLGFAALNCDNGAFCDGVESCDPTLGCQAGTAPAVDDGVACTVDSCDEAADAVVHTPDNALCDDAQFCNGAEICDLVQDCQPGVPPLVDDKVVCTDDSCDEASDAVVNIPNDSYCNDGLFCTGSEVCDPVLDCQAGLPPPTYDGVGCTVDICNESSNVVEHVPDDAACDDGDPGTVDTCDPTLDCQNVPAAPVPLASWAARLLIVVMLGAAGLLGVRGSRRGA
jgi:hypothetical protein